ncbi:MAG TPA: TetR family transcriptional regulator [Pseudonocardiaceae bacterium]
MAVAEEQAEVGLRERKKRRTRAALIDAALRLFRAKGYEATTVEEIAAAVEISPRTFFRYFAGKEDVALAQLDELDELLVDALVGRPEDEPPLTALRAAYRVQLERLAGPDRTTLSRFLTVHHLIEAAPPLLAGSLRRSAEVERLMVAELTRRIGTGPEVELRAALLVRLVRAAARAGFEAGCRRGVLDDPAALVSTVEHTLDLATAGLGVAWGDHPERWGRDGRSASEGDR